MSGEGGKRNLQICTALSLPKLQYNTLTCAINTLVPVFPHPLLSTTSIKTCLALFFGAITKTAIIVIKNPPRCPKSEMVSSIGRALAPQVLKPIVMTRKPSMMSVYCQSGNMNELLVTWIIAWTRVVRTKTEEETEASQPRVDIQPARELEEGS
jgi:hypothetical protein